MKQIRSLLLCVVLLSAIIGLGAQEWAASAGSTVSDWGSAIATDNAGNSYVTGYFSNTIDFGTTTLTCAGTFDIYVAKLDPDGNWLWAKQAGGVGEDEGYGIAVDNDGNVYITGYFEYTAMFGIFPLTSPGYHNIYVAKLTTDGTWLWANWAGGTGYNYGYGITTDDSGNCYITGQMDGTASFGTTNLVSAGSYDVYIAKLNTNGVWQWAKRAGGTSYDASRSIVFDGSSGIYVTGSFEETADFGTDILTSAGSVDIFVCRLNTNGVWQWAARAGGTGHEYALGITTSGNGRIYITGYFIGVTDFNGTSLNSGNTNPDIFVAQLDDTGYWLWAVRAGGSNNEAAYGITADNNGYAYITGRFAESAHFGTTTLTSAGGWDVFVAKLDMSGNWLWAKRAGSTTQDVGNGIAADDSGNCYVAGYFGNTAYFGSEQLISVGDYDVFVAKVSDPTPQIPQNISISNLGNDVIVEWDEVTLDTWDCSIMPDYYFVYYNTDGITEPYQYLTFIPGNLTEYVHQHAGFFSSNHFYQVTAVKFYLADRLGLEDYLNANLRKDMTEAEVQQVLHNLTE
ncbi:MAG: SBBP repeat-containing protein [Candidatus Cloacimonadaceae bacterium]